MEGIGPVTSPKDLNNTNLQEILRTSLDSPKLEVLSVKTTELGGVDQFGSDLNKLVVLVSEEGIEKETHMIVKSALSEGRLARFSILGTFVFHREAIWFKKVLPMLLNNLSPEQSSGLLNIVPKCHYAFSNYEDTDLEDCMFRNIAACFCCILSCRKFEKGFILMENLKERDDQFVDMKVIEKKGITVEYMKMALAGLAHFHGAWWLWLQKADQESKHDILVLYKNLGVMKWKWIMKSWLNMFLDIYIEMHEARKEDPVVIQKLKSSKDSPSTVENIIQAMHQFEGSKYKTMIHGDLWTAQIMFSQNSDGSPKQAKILDYQTINPGHPATDIWMLVYGSTDSDFRKNHFQECLESYFSVLSDYMSPLVDVSFQEFQTEVEERRFPGPYLYAVSPLITLAARERPNIIEEKDKFVQEVKKDLCAVDKDDDHPDLKEMRRRILDLVNEGIELDIIK